MRRYVQIIAVAVALLVAAFLVGRCSAPRIAPEMHVVERVDTLVVRDTILQEKPVYRTRFVRDSIRVAVRDTMTVKDTVWLPREIKVYEDERYRAEVSGYQPSLDRIDIYTQDRVVTQEVVKTVKQKTRWGVGISAGYGVTINTTDQTFRPAPYIGVGIHYNLLSW